MFSETVTSQEMLLYLGAIIVSSILMILIAEKTLIKQITIQPLCPTIMRNYILCEEGIYTVHRIKPNFYSLQPWHRFSIFKIDDKNRLVGLKRGRRFLKLRATIDFIEDTDYFESLKTVIISHLPAGNRNYASNHDKFKWIPASVFLIVPIILYLGISDYYTNIASGKINDDRCDICARHFTCLLCDCQPKSEPLC